MAIPAKLGDTVRVVKFQAHLPWTENFVGTVGKVAEIRENPKLAAFCVGELWWPMVCLEKVVEEEEGAA